MIEHYGSHVYASELVPKWYDSLPKTREFQFVSGRLVGEEGEISINICDERCTSATTDDADGTFEVVNIPCTTLDKFLVKFGFDDIHLIKIDIEGAEIDMLTSSSDELLSKIG